MRWVNQPAICSGLEAMEQPDKCMIKVPTMTQMSMCTTSQRIVKLVGWPVQVEDLNCHRSCIHNELRSLSGRVLQVTTVSNKSIYHLVMEEAVLLAHQIKLRNPHVGDIISLFPTHKKKAYRRAMNSLLELPLRKADASISAFVKYEKLSIMERDGDPRMIQARNQRFNLELGKWTRNIEKTLYQLRDEMGWQVVAKGMNQQRRAWELKKRWDRYQNPEAVSLDLSRWDMHCNQDLIKVMHRFYMEVSPSTDLQRMLEYQLINKGYTRNGIKYSRPGGVMSGDMTTAVGNCVLVLSMILAYKRATKGKWTILDDGDDFVIIGNKEDLSMDRLDQWFKVLGHSLKVEGTTTKFNQIKFCQSKPMFHHGMWEMVPDPRKVLSSAFMYPESKADQRYRAQIYHARAILHQGQPILGPLFRKLHTKFYNVYREIVNPGELTQLDYQLRVDGRTKVTILDIDPESRLQMEVMWGINPTIQEILEGVEIPDIGSPIHQEIIKLDCLVVV